MQTTSYLMKANPSEQIFHIIMEVNIDNMSDDELYVKQATMMKDENSWG